MLIPCVSDDPGRVTWKEYLVYVEDGTESALIESARCLGLTLPTMQARDPMARGSGALGECVRARLDAGIRRFVIGLGGSATNDAGLGLLMSLGLRAMDSHGRIVSPNLQGVMNVAALDVSGMDARLADCELTILCDVDAPLCGPTGATLIFAPQKGLPADMLAAVDAAVERFAGLAEVSFAVSARYMPGSGAAGGLGFALALLSGRLVSGADYVIEQTHLVDRLHGADWVLTGEGRSDAQTLQGKLPLKVAVAARAAGTKVALLSGDVVDAALLTNTDIFDAVIPARSRNMTVETAMDQAASLLRRAACEWVTMLIS